MVPRHARGPRITPPGQAVRNTTLDDGSFASSASVMDERGLRTCYVYNPFTYTMELRRSRLPTGSSGDKGPGPWGVTAPRPPPGAPDFGGLGEVVPTETAQTQTSCVSTCRCNLNIYHLLADPVVDTPVPPAGISRCELHEILRALPPRMQNHPWRLAYDTSRDGFSLRNFYRTMEEVYREGACGIGLFFVTERDRSAESPLGNLADHTSGDAPQEVGAGAREAMKPATHSRCRRRARVGIIGCFTPKVPCLEAHGGRCHAPYGSEETFVFRLRQGGRRVRFSGLLRAGCTTAASTTETSRSLLLPSGEDLRRSSIAAVPRGSGLFDRESRAPTALSVPSTAPRPQALHSIFFDHAASTQLLPSPTWDSPQSGSSSSALRRRGSVAPPTTGPSSEGDEPMGDDGVAVYTLTPVDRGVRTRDAYPTGATATGPAEARQRSVREASPAEAAVPQHVPIIEKFPWARGASSRQFVVAQNSFFAIGGGGDGAALYVDDNLQYCTSSLHCKTFDSPALFGTVAGSTLNHVEMTIVRTIWFAVKDGDGGTFRVMTFTEEEGAEVGQVVAPSSHPGELATTEGLPCSAVCGCGRPSADSQEGARADCVVPTHRCNDGFFAF